MLVIALVFDVASTTIRTSARSMSSRRAGFTQATWSSLPSVRRTSARSRPIRVTGWAPASSTARYISFKRGSTITGASSSTISPGVTRPE
jgi:hypothetical protein